MSKQDNKSTPFTSFINKELELPETIFIRDIENKVFQGIVLQCLASIPDITLLEENFIGSIFHRSGVEGIKGIITEQDSKSHSVSVKIEVNINYGISIPEKAEEIQMKIVDSLTCLTGLHVSCVHVIFKNITPLSQIKKNGGAPREENTEEKKEFTNAWD